MGARSNVDSHSGYSVKFNDDEWVHYQNYIPGNFRDQELLTVDGEITLIRVFERCDEPCAPPAEYLPQQ